MPDRHTEEESRILAAIQNFLNAYFPKRWHGYVWFAFLAFSGLVVTAALAYGLRILLGLGT